MSGREPGRDWSRRRLDQVGLEAAIADRPRWPSVGVVEQTGSTNADLAAMARAGAAEGTVLTTEHQVAGRGRLGRTWDAPARSGLALSVLFRPTGVPTARWPWLSLLTGVAVARLLTDRAGVDAGLKWPNDVVIGERKVAGILIERVESIEGPAAVIGVGLNVDLRAGELPVPTATSLALSGASTLDRTALLIGLLDVLGDRYTEWLDRDGDAEQGLRGAYETSCVTLGREVRAELPSGAHVTGRAVGIDTTGGLLIDSANGRVCVGAADVRHLRIRS